ncbi:hypothetical protein ABZ863_26360 [Saccharomonospora sp. NPDC046836]|uniref:hypothetical protein n=1 Tax=Saccharomonospora sp. NPDC046836 TaxID=3156921 RepID=UPI0033DE04B8
MSSSAESAAAVSDPTSEDYDPNGPFYDVTLDPSSVYYVGPINETARSGDDIRAEVTSLVGDDPLATALSEKERDEKIQSGYSAAIAAAREGLYEDLELRPAGERPTTVWDNASHEQMVEVLSSNADSAAIAETSEEWVRLGNDLTLHQRAVATAIGDSMGNWIGEGGDAAREHLAEVAKWLGVTAQGAELTGRQQQIHSQTLNESQKQMAANPPVHFSAQEANATLQQITDPVQYAQAASQAIQTMQAQQVARAQAARIMTQFDDTVGAAVTMPLFTPPPKLAGGSATTATRMNAPAGGGAGAGGATAQRTDIPVGRRLDAGAGGLGGQGGPGGVGDGGPLSPGGPGSGGLPPGVDPAVAGNQVKVPEMPEMPEMPQTGGQTLPLSAQSGDVPGGGTGGAGLPGGVSFDDTTHRSSTPTMPTPPLIKVPDLPTSGTPGGISSGGIGPGGIGSGPGGSGGIPNIPGTTAPTSYTPPDLTRTGLGKTPTIGWTGGVNGDSISSRLGGLDGGLSGGTTGGRPGSSSTSKPGGGAGGVSAAGIGGVGGIGSGSGSGAAGIGGGAAGGGAAGGTGSGAAPGQASGAAKGMTGSGAVGGAAAAAGAAGARGMTSGTTSGMAGMPPAGGGARPKEEDKEHRVAGYLEADENLFAGEQAIAPPVIGDWKNNKDDDWK